MRKFLNWLFNPRNAGISSALIVGFVAGMGGMSFYIGTMIDTGSLADWFSALGTIGAVAVSLYLASAKEEKYVDLHISSASLVYIVGESSKVGLEFTIYNAGNKPFAWEKTIVHNYSGIGLAFSNKDKDNLRLIAPNEIVKFREIRHTNFDSIWSHDVIDEAYEKNVFSTITVAGPEHDGITVEILGLIEREEW